MDEKIEKDTKIDMKNIKFINPYKTEEQIKNENNKISDNTNKDISQNNTENKSIKFYEIKNNKKQLN